MRRTFVHSFVILMLLASCRLSTNKDLDVPVQPDRKFTPTDTDRSLPVAAPSSPTSQPSKVENETASKAALDVQWVFTQKSPRRGNKIELHWKVIGANSFAVGLVEGCKENNWEPFKPFKEIQISEGSSAHFFVKFKNAKEESACTELSFTPGNFITVPQNTQSYVRSQGSYGGYVFAQGSRIYHGAFGGGLAITSDFGKTWRHITSAQGLAENRIEAIKGNASTVFVLSQESGLSISRDFGATWQVKGARDGLGSDRLRSLNLEGNRVSVASDEGIAVSEDLGDTWKILIPPEFKGFLTGGYVTQNLAVITNWDDLYLSLDFGVTWKKRTLKDLGVIDASSINQVISDGSNIFMMTRNGLCVLRKNAENFECQEVDTTASIRIHEGKLLLDSFDNMTISADAGKTWTMFFDSWATDFYQDSTAMYVAGEKGIIVSRDNGRNWVNLSEVGGFTESYTTTIDVFEGLIYASKKRGLYKSSDSGKNWQEVEIRASFYERTGDVKLNKNLVAFLGGDGGVYVSADKGKTWTNRFRELKANGAYHIFLVGETIYAMSSEAVWVSNDKGEKWSELKTPPNQSLNRIYVNASKIYLGTKAGIFISDLSGKDWTKLDGSKDVVDVFEKGEALFSLESKAFKVSRDGGKVWTTLFANSEWSMGEMDVSEKNYYVTTTAGLLMSSDKGMTWTLKTPADGLSAKLVEGLVVEGDMVYASTLSGISIMGAKLD